MKDRIIALMKNMGMSQKVFAAEICISEGALSSIFSGRTKPTLNTVNNIHERFPEVNMGWLIDGKGEMYNATSSDSTKQDANVMDFSGVVPSGGGRDATWSLGAAKWTCSGCPYDAFFCRGWKKT